MTSTLLMSIRPEYADLIFAGTKKVELRRVKPRVQEGEWILVYVSTPVQALMASAQVGGVIESTPASLWKRFRDEVGVTRRQFDEYYEGTLTAFGIVLSAVELLPKPINLSRLRQRWPDFHPPQCYRYVDNSTLRSIISKPMAFRFSV